MWSGGAPAWHLIQRRSGFKTCDPLRQAARQHLFLALAEEGLSDALMLPLAGRMQTAKGEIPLQLIREQPAARAYKCNGGRWIECQWEQVLRGGKQWYFCAGPERAVHLSTVISESLDCWFQSAEQAEFIPPAEFRVAGCITMDVFLSFCWDIPLFFVDSKGKHSLFNYKTACSDNLENDFFILFF